MFLVMQHELIREHIKDLRSAADAHALVQSALRHNPEASHTLRVQQLAVALVVFTITMAVASTAVVLDEVGNWAIWSMSAWATSLVLYSARVIGPVSVPPPVQARLSSARSLAG